MFNIIFRYIILNLLPIQLRKPRNIAWLSLIMSYLKSIYDDFVVYRTSMLYDINFTGQTCYLEKKLRDIFNIQGLYISDGIYLEPTYLSNRSEGNLPVFINNSSENENIFFLNNLIEFSMGTDFFVNIPAADYDAMTGESLSRMATIINYYLVFGKNYNIKRI